ncbi:MAG: hypothetical protein MRZ91_06520 [Christensenellaceae bacterium]|nr:hypothetical protein [Christensenellaceae bacterium]
MEKLKKGYKKGKPPEKRFALFYLAKMFSSTVGGDFSKIFQPDRRRFF